MFLTPSKLNYSYVSHMANMSIIYIFGLPFSLSLSEYVNVLYIHASPHEMASEEFSISEFVTNFSKCLTWLCWNGVFNVVCLHAVTDTQATVHMELIFSTFHIYHEY